MTTPLEDQLAGMLRRYLDRDDISHEAGIVDALAAYDAAKAAPAGTMDGLTRESLMRCAANAMAKAELFEDDNETLKAGISQRQNEINELKVENDQWRKRFDDSLELLRGSQSTAESSYQRATMIGDERDALKAECAKLRDDVINAKSEARQQAERATRAEAELEKARIRGATQAKFPDNAEHLLWAKQEEIMKLKDRLSEHQNEINALRNATISPAEVLGLRSMLAVEKAECAKLRDDCERLGSIYDQCSEIAKRSIERCKVAEARLAALTGDAAIQAATDCVIGLPERGTLPEKVMAMIAAARQEVCK